MDLGLGDRIDRYVVEGLLGEGGMAVVYRVRHVDLGSAHALKVLLNARPGVVERLLREGRAQGTLRHPNVVAVTDVVRIDGLPGLVMEYVDGADLGLWLRRHRPSLAEIDCIARDVLEGVAAAHRAGIVHRDLKPGNVLLECAHGQIRAKVADFGIAKTMSPEPGGLRTRTGIGMGTPAYMAPEQFVDARSVDVRADVFALGVLLYELITGEMPYGRADVLQLLESARKGQWTDPTPSFPDVPTRWFEAVRRALRPSPDERPADAGALLTMWAGDASRPPAPWTDDAIEASRAEPIDLHPAGGTLSPARSGSVDTAFDLSRPGARRRRWVWGAAVLGAALLLLFAVGASAGLLWATHLREHTRYGAELVWVDGLPSLGRPLPAGAARARDAWHARYRGRRLIRLAWLSAAGHPRPASDPRNPLGTPTLFTFARDPEGALLEQRSARGNVVHQVRVTRSDAEVRLVHLDPQGSPRPSPWSEEVVEGVEVAQPAWEETQTLDDAGRVAERRFLDLEGRPVRASDGTFGVRYRYDAEGRRVRRTGLAADGQAMADQSGVVSYAWTWSGAHPIRIDALGFGDLHVIGPRGWSSVVTEVDTYGLPLRQAWLGVDGAPIANPNGCMAETWRYDASGGVWTSTCLDANGLPTARRTGEHGYRLIQDARGYTVASENLDADGRLVADRAGVARSERGYAEDGLLVEVGPFRDASGAPIVPSERGYAVQRWKWDDLGRLVEVANLGLSGEPIGAGENRVASTRYAYDAWGHTSEIRWFDHRGVPIADDDGCAVSRFRRTRSGALLEETCFGTEEQPVLNHGGWHRLSIDRDVADRPTREHYEDVSGRWVISEERGHAGVRMRYDARGMLAEEVFLDPLAQPFGRDDGRARCEYVHDHRGLEVGVTCFDVEGARTALPDGTSRMEYVYDESGRTIEVRSFDVRDRPITDACAVIEQRYDARGNRVVERCLDGAGRLFAWNGQYAEIQSSWDALGRKTGVQFFDAAGRPANVSGGCARMAYEHDAAGNVVRTSCFGADGGLFAYRDDGLARITDAYDAFGRHVGRSLFGVDGAPLRGGSYWRWEQDHDPLGRIIEERYFDPGDVAPARHPAVIRFTYDALGRVIGTERLGGDGGPYRDGWASQVAKWAADGAKASEAWFDAEGAPVPGPDGCVVVRWTTTRDGGRERHCDDA